ncbi:MAG: TonB-dependent receptor [Sphingomonadales bacterium]|nr:TonB-dependent receptor [Sphingomonadales bacterium]
MNRTKRKALFLSLMASTAFLAMPAASAFAADNVDFLGEVMVTARKRAERADEVPISMSVVSGDKLAEQAIANLENLAPTVPNFHLGVAVAGSDQFMMRGVGSGVNAGFEQAVGTVIDGFFFGRSRYGRSSFMDIERVEILKGPQGALIGKNTSAGVINITTRKPTAEFSAYLSSTYEFEGDEGYTLEGAVSGPLSEKVRARGAFRYDNKDGVMRNLLNNQSEPKFDDFSGRLSIDADLTETLNALLTYQYGDMNHTGRNREFSHCSAASATLLAGLGSPEDCTLNRTRANLLRINGVLTDEVNDTTFHTVGLTLNWKLDQMTITSLTGYSQYRSHDLWDSDLIIRDDNVNDFREKYHQWTQELRATSNGNEHLDYIVGIYLQKTKQRDDWAVTVNVPALPAFLRGTRVIDANQTAETAAAFAQVDWHVTLQVNVSVGGRYTYEKKDFYHDMHSAALWTKSPTVVFPGGPLATTHLIDADRSEENFSPNAVVQWKMNEDTMFYASASRGFKGGGYDFQNFFNQATAENTIEYAGEKSTSFEAGTKITFAEKRAHLNLTVFTTKFKDLQVSALTESGDFAVGNAGAARTSGVEADLKWRPVDDLMLTFAGAYLDAHYTSFADAPCFAGQTALQGCVGNVQDLSGHSMQFAPDWTFSANAEYTIHMGDGFLLTPAGTVYYSAKKYLTLDLDPLLIQKSYTKFDARLTFTKEDAPWSIAVIGRNLGDKLTSGFGNRFGTAGGGTDYFRFVDPPRSIAVQARFNF